MSLRSTGLAVEAVALADDFAAAADESGVYVWHRESGGWSTRPVRLEPGPGPICALRVVADGLWGLARNGFLVQWSLERLMPVATIAAPCPPRKTALVSLLYAPEAAELLWPARGGLLASYSLNTGQGATILAHAGSFYVLLLHKGTLLTLGRHDGTAKQWTIGADRPSRVWNAPPDVTAGALLPGAEDLVLLLNGAGDATAYRFDGNSLTPVYTVDSSAPYRAVAGLEPTNLEAACERRRRELVEAWVAAVEAGRLPDGFASLDEVFERLTNLGYGHVALELQANAIRARGPAAGSAWVEELAVRVRQAEYFNGPRDPSPAMVACLRRLAELHEALFQWPQAWECYRRLDALNVGVAGALERVGRMCEAQAVDELVAVPGDCVSLEDLAAGSRVVGNSLAGLLSIKRLAPIETRRVGLSPEEVLREIDAGAFRHWVPRVTDMLWVEESACRRYPTLCLLKPDPPSGICCALACPFPDGAADPRPHVVVGGTNSAGSDSPRAEALGEAIDLLGSPEAASWVGRSFGALIRAVNRVANRKIELEY